MSVTTIVDERPLCDFCRLQGKAKGPDTEAHYDGKTVGGPWAFMCLRHWKQNGIKLGTGFGQRLYLEGEVQ